MKRRRLKRGSAYIQPPPPMMQGRDEPGECGENNEIKDNEAAAAAGKWQWACTTLGGRLVIIDYYYNARATCGT